MYRLGIDIETYSSTDLMKSGVYKYIQADDFEIMLFAYSLNEGEVQIVDLAQGEKIPSKIFALIEDPLCIKTAHNANFERNCLNKFFKLNSKIEQWDCTMIKATMLGLPLSLDAASRVLKIAEKDKAGKTLIRFFSMPCKPTKSNGMRVRNLPADDLDKWEAFKNYCVQDVVVEQEIRAKVDFFDVPQVERQLWVLDQKINDTGILLDVDLIGNAMKHDKIYRDKLTKEAIELTGMNNPNSVAQIKKWIEDETDTEVESLNKETIPELLKNNDSKLVKRVLNIRQEMSKTSIKKYAAMMHSLGEDLRVRGLLQYYGANRTGRWAGRLVQVQNLPRNDIKDLDLARRLVKENDLDLLELLFGNVPVVLSQLIRTAFIAGENNTFIVSDFSAIEARVVAWLAKEKWRLDVFADHGKIYEASGAHMFKVPIESVTKGSVLRDKAKIAELALGYQGSVNALLKMGAVKMGLKESELQGLVNLWRNANKAIVRLWYDIGNAAVECVRDNRRIKVKDVVFFMQKGIMFIQLPSGRCLTYLQPKIKRNRFDMDGLIYMGVDQTTKQWNWQETYGGKLVENIVQAIARDCLADAMLRLDKVGFKIVMHVHDEVVLEVPKFKCKDELNAVNKIMGERIKWAKDLPLGADSFLTEYYIKN